LIADVYNGNDNYQQKLEETVVKILIKQNGAFVRHALSFSNGTNSYLNWGKQLLTVIPAIKRSYEIVMITDKFFSIFEQQIPTFEYFLQQSDPSISQQTATEIRQLLEEIITVQEDTLDFVAHYSNTDRCKDEYICSK
jgi:hypothetical protein